MAISSTTMRVSYSGNGATTAFSFPYEFDANADLVVIVRTTSTGAESTKVLDTDYTVTGAGNPSGGTVTMLSAPATGTTISIFRDPDITQTLDLADNSALPAEDLENGLDRIVMIIQRQNDLVSRSVRLSDGFSGTFDTALPGDITDNPGASMITNAAGDGWEMGPTADEIANAQTYATNAAASEAAAAASATAAAASEAAAATSETNAAASETAAGLSETAAAASEAAAAASEAAAAASETAAAASQAAAATSETNAATSASAASTSATNAATSETNASNSATAAAGSATSASTSAINASNSAAAAAASAAAAAASAAQGMWLGDQSYTSASSPVTVLAADSGDVLKFTTASGAITFNLPTPTVGLRFTFKDTGGSLSTNAATIARNGSEQIEGVASNYTLESNYGSWTLYCDGTNWHIL